MMHIYVLAS